MGRKKVLQKRQSHPLWVCGLKSQNAQIRGGNPLVTPFMGVWIEILLFCQCGRAMSRHTLYGCVD